MHQPMSALPPKADIHCHRAFTRSGSNSRASLSIVCANMVRASESSACQDGSYDGDAAGALDAVKVLRAHDSSLHCRREVTKGRSSAIRRCMYVARCRSVARSATQARPCLATGRPVGGPAGAVGSPRPRSLRQNGKTFSAVVGWSGCAAFTVIAATHGVHFACRLRHFAFTLRAARPDISPSVFHRAVTLVAHHYSATSSVFSSPVSSGLEPNSPALPGHAGATQCNERGVRAMTTPFSLTDRATAVRPLRHSIAEER